MKKHYLLAMLIATTLAFTGCSDVKPSDSSQATASQSSTHETKAYTVNYEYNGENYSVSFKGAPKKAISLSHFTTEMLLAIGAEDHLIGRGHSTNKILPEFEEAFNRIPVISEKGYPSKEILLNLEPDFVTGWSNFLSEKNSGPIDYLLEQHMNPLILKSAGGSANLDTVYDDFRMLGDIFDVKTNAEKVIASMQKEAKEVSDKTKDISQKVKVIGYDSGEDQPFVVAGGLGGSLIEAAGGINAFANIKDTPTGYKTISWEEIASQNPDVFVVVDYQWKDKTGFDEKVAFLKNHPLLKDVTAIKNNAFVRVELADLSPGVRNTRILKDLAKGFYNIDFN